MNISNMEKTKKMIDEFESKNATFDGITELCPRGDIVALITVLDEVFAPRFLISKKQAININWIEKIHVNSDDITNTYEVIVTTANSESTVYRSTDEKDAEDFAKKLIARLSDNNIIDVFNDIESQIANGEHLIVIPEAE